MKHAIGKAKRVVGNYLRMGCLSSLLMMVIALNFVSVDLSAQKLTAMTDGTYDLDSGLFRDHLRSVEGVQSAEETASLVEMIRIADAAYETGMKTARDPVGFKEEFIVAQLNELEGFLVAHPNSTWGPSLRANMAKHYRERGQYTRALMHWEAAWQRVGNAGNGVAREIADDVLIHYTRLLGESWAC